MQASYFILYVGPKGWNSFGYPHCSRSHSEQIELQAEYEAIFINIASGKNHSLFLWVAIIQA